MGIATRGRIASPVLGAALALVMGANGGIAQDRSAFPHRDLAHSVVERHVLPGYARFELASNALATRIDAWCATGMGPAVVEAAFDDVVRAWGRIEHIDFGPIAINKSRDRILFHPDRKGLAQRQREAAVTASAPVAQGSIAFDGLTALDDFLFADGRLRQPSSPQWARRCGLAATAAARLSATSTKLVEGWQQSDGYARDWLHAGGPDSALLREDETTRAIARTFDSGIARLRDERIAAALGFGKTRSIVEPPLRGSRRHMLLLSSACGGLQHFYVEGAIWRAIDQALPPARKEQVEPVTAGIGPELEGCVRTVAPMIGPHAPVGVDAARQALIGLGFPLKQVRHQVSSLLAEFGGVTLGFNASDGD